MAGWGRSLTRVWAVPTFLSSMNLRALTVALALAGISAGCVQITGGAVEVSWEVQANGRAITDCS